MKPISPFPLPSDVGTPQIASADAVRPGAEASRRAFLAGMACGGGALALGLMKAPAWADDAQKAGGEPPWRHGMSLMGQPGYPADARHFKYVNPEAPKGGLVRLGALGGFDNFNIAVDGAKGDLENLIGTIYDTLMEPALDEVGAEYGLIAEAARHPDDYSWVSFRLRPEARWHDGAPINVDDVIFSFETQKKLNPRYAFYWRDVTAAEKTGPREVTFRFSSTGNRELPQILGQMNILPKHWWEGVDARGRKRDVAATTLEAPLGSGPYRLKACEAGRWSEYERVPDYWGANLMTRVGMNNFDRMRVEYYRDTTVLFEAFKGDRYDFRSENIARNWATGYDFPAVKDGKVVLEEFAQRSRGVMQAFVFNLRRPQFQDERVRRALNYAFDFHEVNRTLFFGQYQRINSYFFGTELASSGLPEGREKEILESVKDLIPASVFTTPYTNPTVGDGRTFRDNLAEAHRLLGEAGWERKGAKLVSKDSGAAFVIEFLGFDANMERYVVPYRNALERLGITVSIRVVDASQYQNRMRSFDFDATTGLWAESLSPGNEQSDYWGSAAAKRAGSRNLAGISDKGVDALIEKVVYATTRDELVAAVRALDRVLLAHNFVVPQWSYNFDRTARWNRFAHPQTMPEYGAAAFPTVWWYDAALAARVGPPR